jgi:uncharacterized protein YkwD
MSLFHHLFLPHHSNNQRAKLLHPSSWVILIIVFALFQFSLTKAGNAYPQILGYASQISPTEVIRLTNVKRQSTGLNPVNVDPQLNQAAARKAADMFARDYWAHVSPVGTQPWTFISDSGYVYRYAGENLARDFSDPNSVVEAWMNSPSHRENLLSARYSDIGVAVVDGTLDGRETTLVVQMFGTRLAANPSVNAATTFRVKAEAGTKDNLSTPTPIIVPTRAPVVAAGITLPAKVTPFALTKYLSFGLLGIIILVLAVDVLVISRHKVARWTSKSFAHLIFLTIILVAVATILRGQII